MRAARTSRIPPEDSLYQDIAGGGYSSAMSGSLPTLAAATEAALEGDFAPLPEEEARREAADMSSLVRKWTLPDVAPLAAIRAPWWPHYSKPKDGSGVMQQVGGDGTLRETKNVLREELARGTMSLYQLKIRMEERGLSPTWLLKGVAIVVWGDNAAGHGFGVVLYFPEELPVAMSEEKMEAWGRKESTIAWSYIEVVTLND